jgi:peptidoglycan/xylan/chitin deacetylase (PgdA/CDA1 family)
MKPPPLALTGAVLLTVLAPVLVLASSPAATPGPVYVALRYDDYCAAPPSGTDPRWVADHGFLEMFARLGVRPLVAVIPKAESYDGKRVVPFSDPRNAARAHYLAHLFHQRKIDVAQHGLSHAFRPGVMPHTEFAGWPWLDQLGMIAEGRQVLEGILGQAPTAFVPPSNTYDAATLHALGALGFRLISGRVGEGVATDARLQYLPGTVEYPRFEGAVRNALNFPGPTIVIGILHPFDAREYTGRAAQPTLAQIEVTLRRVLTLPGVQVTSMEELARQHPELVTARHEQLAHRLSRAALAPVLSPFVFRAYGGRHGWAWWPEQEYQHVALVLEGECGAGVLVVLLAASLLISRRRRRAQ